MRIQLNVISLSGRRGVSSFIQSVPLRLILRLHPEARLSSSSHFRTLLLFSYHGLYIFYDD